MKLKYVVISFMLYLYSTWILTWIYQLTYWACNSFSELVVPLTVDTAADTQATDLFSMQRASMSNTRISSLPTMWFISTLRRWAFCWNTSRSARTSCSSSVSDFTLCSRTSFCSNAKHTALVRELRFHLLMTQVCLDHYCTVSAYISPELLVVSFFSPYNVTLHNIWLFTYKSLIS